MSIGIGNWMILVTLKKEFSVAGVQGGVELTWPEYEWEVRVYMLQV